MPVEIGLWKLAGTEAVQAPTQSLDKEGRLEDILEKLTEAG